MPNPPRDGSELNIHMNGFLKEGMVDTMTGPICSYVLLRMFMKTSLAFIEFSAANRMSTIIYSDIDNESRSVKNTAQTNQFLHYPKKQQLPIANYSNGPSGYRY